MTIKSNHLKVTRDILYLKKKLYNDMQKIQI